MSLHHSEMLWCFICAQYLVSNKQSEPQSPQSTRRISILFQYDNSANFLAVSRIINSSDIRLLNVGANFFKCILDGDGRIINSTFDDNFFDAALKEKEAKSVDFFPEPYIAS